MSYQCTIVTAYYDFPRKKHASQSYQKWIQLFLHNVTSNIIIFTDKSSYTTLADISNGLNNVKIVILPISEFYTSKYLPYWQKDYNRDYERHHNPHLYMIWNEKTMFIQRAINMNHFNTEYYAWTDIGMVRDEKQIPFINNYPNPNIIKTLKKNKVYLLNIEDFTPDDLNETGSTERFIRCNRIGGGVIFGHKNILLKWTQIYYDMMRSFIKNDFFTGKDQSVMACIYLKYRENLIELVKPIQSPIDPWFYMLYYLGNKSITNTTNTDNNV